MGRPVAGSIELTTFPSAAGCHAPPMSNCLAGPSRNAAVGLGSAIVTTPSY
jgi:hypothetical protein